MGKKTSKIIDWLIEWDDFISHTRDKIFCKKDLEKRSDILLQKRKSKTK